MNIKINDLLWGQTPVARSSRYFGAEQEDRRVRVEDFVDGKVQA